MGRLAEIAARKAEIRSILENGTECDLKALESELRELNDEQNTLETRQRLISEAAKINDGVGETRKITDFTPNPSPEKRGIDSDEYRSAFMDYVLRGDNIPSEFRASTKTSEVGAVIPNTVLNKIVEKLEATGMILPLVTRTGYKGGVSIPTSTVKPVATWVSEGSGSDKQNKTTGNITFAYHKLRCAVAVSFEVDTVTLAVFEQTLISNIVEAMTKALEESIIKGTGSGQPKGILTEDAVEGQEITVTKLDYKTLVDAEGALPLEYENGAVWCMTKKTFMGFAGMVDSNGQPIARTNFGIGGSPERTLLGRQVILCNYLDSYTSTLSTGTKFAFMFNFKDYVLNTNYQMGIKKYEDNDTDDQVTKAIMLADGKVVDNNSLVILKK